MIYSLVPIIGFIAVLIINWEILFKKRYPYRNRKAYIAFRLLILSTLVFLTTDIAWGFLDSLENKYFVTIDTAFFFIAESMMIFFWLVFVSSYTENKTVYSRILRGVGYLFITAGLVLVVINFFTPVLFSYEGSSYTSRMGRYAYFTMALTMYVGISIYELIKSFTDKESKKNQHFAIFVAATSMTATTLLQLFFPLLPMITMGAVSSNAIVHMFVALAEKDRYRARVHEAEDREKETLNELESTKELAFRDPLTGVKSKHAYVEFENLMDQDIRDKKIGEFALCLFDLNDLKVINDTYGHEMGDKYIIKSCQLIGELLPNCDIYRVGGDEFVVVLEGQDYADRYALIEKFNAMIDENINTNEPVIAVGFSDYMPSRDNTMRAIFNRADERMYADKEQYYKEHPELKR